MDNTDRIELENALEAIASMTDRCKKAQLKFAEGTAQYTLQKNRINALRTASALIERELAGRGDTLRIKTADLERARAPIASLISKSEKAQQKLAPGSWQHRMLENNLKALYLASPLLAKALGDL